LAYKRYAKCDSWSVRLLAIGGLCILVMSCVAPVLDIAARNTVRYGLRLYAADMKLALNAVCQAMPVAMLPVYAAMADPACRLAESGADGPAAIRPAVDRERARRILVHLCPNGGPAWLFHPAAPAAVNQSKS